MFFFSPQDNTVHEKFRAKMAKKNASQLGIDSFLIQSCWQPVIWFALLVGAETDVP